MSELFVTLVRNFEGTNLGEGGKSFGNQTASSLAAEKPQTTVTSCCLQKFCVHYGWSMIRNISDVTMFLSRW